MKPLPILFDTKISVSQKNMSTEIITCENGEKTSGGVLYLYPFLGRLLILLALILHNHFLRVTELRVYLSK